MKLIEYDEEQLQEAKTEDLIGSAAKLRGLLERLRDELKRRRDIELKAAGWTSLVEIMPPDNQLIDVIDASDSSTGTAVFALIGEGVYGIKSDILHPTHWKPRDKTILVSTHIH